MLCVILLPSQQNHFQSKALAVKRKSVVVWCVCQQGPFACLPHAFFGICYIKVALLSSTPLHSVPFLFLLLLAINPPGFKNRDNLRTSDPRVLVTHSPKLNSHDDVSKGPEAPSFVSYQRASEQARDPSRKKTYNLLLLSRYHTLKQILTGHLDIQKINSHCTKNFKTCPATKMPYLYCSSSPHSKELNPSNILSHNRA